jgi:dihydropteroate synthase
MQRNYKIMGVLNVTPDSFSDAGKYYNTDLAILQAEKLISQGADIIDIGGESTRPGADSISIEEELKRVIPVIKHLHQSSIKSTLSIDTSKPEVMLKAVQAGANFINDVNALQALNAVNIVADANIPVCLMHKQGTPKSMQNQPVYSDVVKEVIDFFSNRVDACLAAGINQNNIILDPGIGFGKTLEHNLSLLTHIKQLKLLGFPVLIGVSRKSMIGEILNEPIENRLYGSLAIAQYAYMNDADIFRVHDVKATADVLKVTQSLINHNK